MNTTEPLRTTTEGVALLLGCQRAATSRIHKASGYMAAARYEDAYAQLDEACGYIVALLDLTQSLSEERAQ